MDNFGTWKRLMRYLIPYRTWAAIAIFGIIGNTVLMVAIPAILGDVIDIGIARGDSDYMIAAGLLVVGMGVMRGITGFMFRYFGEKLSHFIAYDIRNEVYNKVQNLSFSYHDKAQTGTIITRAISDVDEVQRYFAFALIDGLVTATLMIGISAIMIIESPVLAIVSLLPLIPLAYFSRRFALMVDPMWRQIMDRLQTLGNYIQENSLGAEVVRAFNRERYEIEKFGKDNDQLYYERVELIAKWATFMPLTAFIIAFSTAIVLFLGGIMERDGLGGVTVGLIVAFNAYILQLAQPVRFLGFVILLTTQAVSSASRVFEILDEPTTIKSKPDATLLDDIKGNVKFENVTFAYDEDRQLVLKNISLEAKPGQVVAIIGPTGSGKSSLTNLIPRYYDVQAGRVLIDGIDVRDLDITNLRSRIGMVLQSSLLFSATVRENIAYGKPHATEAEIIAAAKAANAHDFIMEFPDTYETLIGERGVTLSGGQRQRIAIARALLINPRILILDDSTSSVDTRTEHFIRDALSRIMRNRTTFIIAQRLNSVQDADQILVVDRGEIVERGTHDELLALNGQYAEIYHLQMEDQERVRRELIAVGQLNQNETIDKRLATDEFRAIIDFTSGD